MLAVLGAADSPCQSAKLHVPAPPVDARPRPNDRLIFDAKRSTKFVEDLESYLASIPSDDANIRPAEAALIETFTEAAVKDGVAETGSGALVDLAYDWIDRPEWKYFIRVEVEFDSFDALLQSAKTDPAYRAMVLALLAYGGQGIRDFKHYVPVYIDLQHELEDFPSVRSEPSGKRAAQRIWRLAAQRVELNLSRYRTALASLREHGIDSATLVRIAESERKPQLKSILLHYAELARIQSQNAGDSDELGLRTKILLTDVEREYPALIMAVLRTLEKDKQAVFDRGTNAFEVNQSAFRFLVEEQNESNAALQNFAPN